LEEGKGKSLNIVDPVGWIEKISPA